ncbi:MAG: NAD(P)-dependent oxidoreductase [Anaerolineales bacterium]|nr:NAD(P)-dependent oxidoreductase [Anaerolineales bacterium]
MKRIAILGLGIIGGGIARNLLRKGHPVAVWNRTPARAEPLRALGAEAAPSPAAAARGAAVVIDAVTDVDASRTVWTGEQGALAAMAPGAAAVECATLTVNWIRELHGLAAARGIAFVDCPVTGGREGAEKGTLTLLIGAEEDALAAVRPVLEAFSARIFRFGPPGMGTAYKLINNLILAAQILVTGEGIAFAERSGLELSLVAEAVQAGAMASPIVQAKLPFILKRDFSDTNFALRWMLKDLRYGLEYASEIGLRLPAAERICELFAEAEARGWGGQDYAVVAELARPSAGERQDQG